jgi:hypothetical protein
LSIFTTAIGPPLPPGNPEIGLKPTLAVSLTSGAAVSVVVELHAESANVATEARAISFNVFVMLQTIGVNAQVQHP